MVAFATNLTLLCMYHTIICNVHLEHPDSKQSRVLHPTEQRIVSIRECPRAQGFRDFDQFGMHGTKRLTLKRIGPGTKRSSTRPRKDNSTIMTRYARKSPRNGGIIISHHALKTRPHPYPNHKDSRLTTMGTHGTKGTKRFF